MTSTSNISCAPGLPRDWIPTLVRFLERQPLVARVVVTEARGSTPREPGAFMLVGHNCVEGSIGGGRLEWEAIAAARELLADPAVPVRTSKVVLAADVGQCCGGVVSFWLEKFTRDDLPVLRAASDAGARGAAVLVTDVIAGAIRRRVVRHESHRRTRLALSDASTSEAGSATNMPSHEPPGGPPLALSVATAAAAERLPHEPQLHAQSSTPAVTSIVTVAVEWLPSEPRLRPQTPAPAVTSVATTAADRLLREPRQRAAPLVLTTAPNTLTFLERLDDNLPAVWLYGAGHVGQALARILMELPLRLTWIDSRAELFPHNLPDSVRVLQDPDPVLTVSEAPVGAYVIVMSHSHPLDFDLCHALLERNDFAWLGLIGSDSKAARFRSRLARTGLGPEVIAKLVCPIGVGGITSKWPAAIAVAVAAQLMQRISSAASERPEPLPPPPPPSVSSAPCAPEQCATCGSTAASPSTNTTPSPHPNTVNS